MKKPNDTTRVSRIIVVLEGGLVRNIISDVPIEVFVRDIDKGSEEGIVNTHWEQNEITVDSKEVDKIVAEFTEDEKNAEEKVSKEA